MVYGQLRTVLSVGLLYVISALQISTAYGASRCEQYAQNAVAEHQQNLQNQCGFTGPRWSSDFQGHYGWCLAVSSADAQRETAERNNELMRCGGGTQWAVEDCTYGPDTCIRGFVWREAGPNDHVCVTPGVREQTRNDNAQAAARRSPTGGPFGRDTCLAGFVWREAFPHDFVCVTPETRAETAQDNSQANARDACPHP